MLYLALRSAARLALRWFYSDVIVQGRERIPALGPVLIVANHPNALVDALLVATTIERRVLLTGKATLFEHPLLALLLGALGVVPLRRVKDERGGDGGGNAVSRNADAFEMVMRALSQQRVVLVFPEGISHDAPSLAPLKSGAARMALQAHDAGIRTLRVLPLGLVFEEKERPRSTVLVRVGESIDIDTWCVANSADSAAMLTREIDMRLRLVTLNFASDQRAVRSVRVAQALAAVVSEPLSLGNTAIFATQAEIAERVEQATEALEHAPAALTDSADVFTARLGALEARLKARGASLADVRVSLRVRHGAAFVLREGILLLLAVPVAALGRVTHWLPIRLARVLALQSARGDRSRDQPAMRTIIAGLMVVLVWYGLQALLVGRWLGDIVAALWISMIVVAAQIDLLLEERMARAWRRARTYLVLRSDSAFRITVLAEIASLLDEAVALETALTESTVRDRPR